MARVDIKDGKDLIFHVTRRISDSKYEFVEAALGKFSKIKGARTSEPVVKTEGGTLIMSVPKEEMEKVQRSINTTLRGFDVQYGKKIGAKDINAATKKLKVGG